MPKKNDLTGLGQQSSASLREPVKKGQVHIFKIFDKYFVLDVGSGSLSELDEIAWNIVRLLDDGVRTEMIKKELEVSFDTSQVESAIAEVLRIIESGGLFSVDSMQVPTSRTTLGSLCFIMTKNCNLRCDYCYVHHDNGLLSSTNNMDDDTAKRAVDYLIEESALGKNLSISFFGGEPLLNFSTIMRTVEYANARASEQGKSIRYNITTNLTLLDKRIRDFLAQHSEITLIVSLDGGKSIHDRHRRFTDGEGCFDRAADNLKVLLNDTRIDQRGYSVRGTYTPKNLDLVGAVAQLRQIGARDLSVEPAILKGGELEIVEKDMQAIKENYDALALYYIEETKNKRPFSFFHFQTAINGIVDSTPRHTPCGAAAGYMAVDTDGSLYPCHRFVGNPKYLLGHVQYGVTKPELKRSFSRLTVNQKPACRGCWAKYHCGGGCHHHGESFHNNPSVPYGIDCEIVKYRIELGAYIYAVLNENESNGIGHRDILKKRPEYLTY